MREGVKTARTILKSRNDRQSIGAYFDILGQTDTALFKNAVGTSISARYNDGFRIFTHDAHSLVCRNYWPIQPLKFWNGLAIPSSTLVSMWLLIHDGSKLNPCLQKGPRRSHMAIDFIKGLWSGILPLDASIDIQSSYKYHMKSDRR